MSYAWSKTVFPIAAIFSFRMLGLFLLIPVFSLLAGGLQDATPALIGLALGAYGLTQGLLQMPFGMLSDKWGRKPVISVGLILFACGSLLGAVTHSIYGMIIARILQGTGAIGSVLIALLADLTPDEQRTQAMAVIGMTIGTSFSLAMVLSPIVTHYFGLAGIFYLTAGLSVLGLGLVYFVIPNPVSLRFHPDSEAKVSLIKTVLCNPHLQRLNAGIFCQHFILTATFFSVPFLLAEQVKQGHLAAQWHFYLPLMLGSFLLMLPFIVLAEKKNVMKPVFIMAVWLTALCQGLLAYFNTSFEGLSSLLLIYFIAFNFLEASLPSWISKQVDPRNKGTAMGVYSTGQFLGIFAGGGLAGVLFTQGGSALIFCVNAGIACLWLLLSCFMQRPLHLTTLMLHYPEEEDSEESMVCLWKLSGVKEVILDKAEQTLYLRIKKSEYVIGSAELCLQKKRP